MGYRLSKIYTRTGDKGTTGLATGERVDKDDLRIETLGTVDELLSSIGLLIASLGDSDTLTATLQQVQHRLFDIGSEIALPGHVVITSELVSWLEERLDEENEKIPPLKEFILPGGSMAAANCHMTRAICRKLERRMVSLAKQTTINPYASAYVNRLSDLLFVYARAIARQDNGKEILWEPLKKKEA